MNRRNWPKRAPIATGTLSTRATFNITFRLGRVRLLVWDNNNPPVIGKPRAKCELWRKTQKKS